MPTFRHAAALLAALALLPLASACTPSCEEVCDKRILCQSKSTGGLISESRASCLSDCEAGLCSVEEKSKLAAECYEQMVCSTVIGAASELLACASRCD